MASIVAQVGMSLKGFGRYYRAQRRSGPSLHRGRAMRMIPWQAALAKALFEHDANGVSDRDRPPWS
jgi:hypothetical protein